ncbi:retropepsin-like aspartic protease family protein [Alsobacter sp. R-9]
MPYAGEKAADFQARVKKACAATPTCARAEGTLSIAVQPDAVLQGAPAAPFVGERPAEFEQRTLKASRGLTPSRAPIVTGPSTVEHSPNAHGQFHLDTTVDGVPVTMLLDTGASLVALSSEDAARAGIRLQASDYRSSLATANGMVAAAPVRLREMKIGSITARDVEAVVLPPGSLVQSLLGMSFLRRIDRVEIVYGRLKLSGY